VIVRQSERLVETDDRVVARVASRPDVHAQEIGR